MQYQLTSHLPLVNLSQMHCSIVAKPRYRPKFSRIMIPFNPLDKNNLGESVASALLRQPLAELCSLRNKNAKFSGAGVYAIYYAGDFEPYLPIAIKCEAPSLADRPIYVGKAIPAGGRKGLSDAENLESNSLHKRLREHLGSIADAENLDDADFYFRCLVVDEIWIPLAERRMIVSSQPVWNVVVDGFGNHNPGKGRKDMLRPSWDMLHPGRAWASRLAPHPNGTADLMREIARFFAEQEAAY